MAPAGESLTRGGRGPSLTTLSLLGLVAGLALGATASLAGPPLRGAFRALEPVGELWTNALRGVVLPLVLANLLLAIATPRGGRSVGRASALSFALFVGLLAIGAAFTLLLSGPLLGAFHVGPETLAAFRSGAPAMGPGEPVAPPSFHRWLVSLVPPNPFRALLEAELLGLLVFTIPFAFAVSRLEAGLRDGFLVPVRAVGEAMGVVLRWILWFTPFGVFALTGSMVARTGGVAIGAIGYYVAMVSGLLVAFLPVLYLVAWGLGRMPPGRFARGVLPAQALAVSTRSSLASLPGLIAGAEKPLGLPRDISGLVLPLSVSVFKVNRTISSTAKLLFLAHLYGIPLDAGTLGTFLVSVLLLSFGSPGVPTAMGSLNTLPAYLAAGLPIEGVLVLGAVDAIPDIFKTLLNVTGDMTVATVVARFTRGAGAPPAPGPEAREPAAGGP